MAQKTRCAKCNGTNFDFIPNTNWKRCYCHDCGSEQDTKTYYSGTPQERQRAAVYATGNRWAIENFNATHN